jgi:hypothetical protein
MTPLHWIALYLVILAVIVIALSIRGPLKQEHQIPDLEGDYRRAYDNYIDAINRRDTRSISSTLKALQEARHAQLRGGR